MLTYIIEDLRSTLEECIPLPLFIYDDKNDGGFCGITDTKDNYGYIRLLPGLKQYRFNASDQGCQYEKVTADYRLVVDINKKINIDEALEIINCNLSKAAASCGIIMRKVCASVSTDDIYKAETGAKTGWKDCDHQLLSIDFSLTVDQGCGSCSVGCLTDLM